MVNIPVQAYVATKDRTVHFHQIHKSDKARIRQKLVCEADQQEVSRDELLKGFEIAPGQYVVFEKDELEKLSPEKNQNIEVSDFVDQDQIDPVYFEKPYYILPKGNSQKAYKLLLEAMKESKKIGIGKFVMRGKEYLGALRPLENVICLEIMRFSDEVVKAESIEPAASTRVKLKDSELTMAKQLIETLYTDFDPQAYEDEYRKKVHEAIEAKAQGQEVVTAPAAAPEPTKVADLMSALKNSLEEAKKRKRKTA
jgi:DNA end-binding protein Ku